MPLQNEKNIILLSEIGQLPALEHFLGEHPEIVSEGYTLIPIDIEIENVLMEKGIPFVSGREYRTRDADFMVLAEEWPRALFESKDWLFFSYRGVSLSQLYFLSVQWYLSHLLYYADIVANVIHKHIGLKRLVVFPAPDGTPPMGSVLVARQIHAFVDAAECIGRAGGVEVIVQNIDSALKNEIRSASFTLKRGLFSVGILLLNIIVASMRSKREISILASDYWKNLEPYIKNLPAEIMLIDRQEAFKAGIKNIWKYRMRFVHPDSFRESVQEEQSTARENIARQWSLLKQQGTMPTFEFRGFSLRPLFVQALEAIIRDVLEERLEDIDDTHAMLKRLKPQVVALRATVSTQTHFVILAQVARAQGIPSIEMQHGFEYYGPGSVSKRHRSEYTGVYGPLTARQLAEVGDNDTTPVIIGSPRFDVYASLRDAGANKKSTGRVTVLCVAPAVDPGGDFDTYETEEFFKTIANAATHIPNIHVIVKRRPGPNRDEWYLSMIASLFSTISHEVAQFEPFAELYPCADIVISCYSTAAIEAMQCGKPLIYLGVSPEQAMMGVHHFSYYASQGAMMIATTEAELSTALVFLVRDQHARAEVSKHAVAFLDREYAFDGRANERAAELVRSLAASKR